MVLKCKEPAYRDRPVGLHLQVCYVELSLIFLSRDRVREQETTRTSQSTILSKNDSELVMLTSTI